MEAGYKRVINIPACKEKALIGTKQKNCLECWKKIIPLAEKKKITLLGTPKPRDDSHPMKAIRDTLATTRIIAQK